MRALCDPHEKTREPKSDVCVKGGMMSRLMNWLFAVERRPVVTGMPPENAPALSPEALTLA
jgi:hypothetical protein